MHRHPLRSFAATLLLSLSVLGTATDAFPGKARVKICPDGAAVTSPAKCPPPPGSSAVM